MSTVSTISTPGHTLATSVQSVLRRIEEWTDRLAPAAAVLIVLLFAVWAWFGSREIRLQFDELLEISAANAPTSNQVLSFLASGVDFNPPLSHFAIRGSTSLLGNTELAMRLPAFLGVVALLICLYIFVSQRLSRSLGIVAMLLILCLPVRDYAIQARPYGMVLGFSGLALVLYRYAIPPRHSVFAMLGLAICTAALVASHYYAILVVGVLFAAELFRIWLSKRVDWVLLACFAVPPAIVLFLLRDAVKQQRQVLTHYFARGNLLSFDHGYDVFDMDPLVYCVALVLIAGILALRSGSAERPALAGAQPPHELVLAIGLLLLPVIGALFTQFVTHAYVPRYFLPASLGLAICLCYVASIFSRSIPGLTVILLLSLSLGFGKALMQEVSRPPEALPQIGALIAEQTPLLFDTPGTYAQVYHYFPSLRDNLWVIADPSASLRYRNYDTDDRIMLALAKNGGAQTISLSSAARKWPHFRLIPRSADYIWALKCVLEAGSEVKVAHPFGSSNFIFDVTVPATGLAQVDACAQIPAPPLAGNIP